MIRQFTVIGRDGAPCAFPLRYRHPILPKQLARDDGQSVGTLHPNCAINRPSEYGELIGGGRRVANMVDDRANEAAKIRPSFPNAESTSSTWPTIQDGVLCSR